MRDDAWHEDADDRDDAHPEGERADLGRVLAKRCAIRRAERSRPPTSGFR